MLLVTISSLFLRAAARRPKDGKEGPEEEEEEKGGGEGGEYINKTVVNGVGLELEFSARWGYRVCGYSIVTVAMETLDSISGRPSSSDQISQDNNPMLSACV